jgi:oligoendopeptidase F
MLLMASVTQPLDPPKVRWDLSTLFSGMDDPRIAATWERVHQRAGAFREAYKGKIAAPELDARTLLTALVEYESLCQDADKPETFAQLVFAADCGDPKNGAFLQAQMEKASVVRVKLIFFELEIQRAPEGLIERLVEDSSLSNYRHFLKTVRARAPHRLSEAEEVILEEVANTGSRAWVRLFEEITSNHAFRVMLPGAEEAEDMTMEEVFDLLHDPDRPTRQAAADALTAGLKELERTLVFIYNNLLQDRKVDDRLRKHPYPEHQRHLSDELDKDTVDLVVGMCKERHDLVERYYLVKRRLMGLDELTHIDRYAPLTEAKEQVPFDTARDLVIESFGSFHPAMREAAARFFEHNWIDAEPREGKMGGAFCMYSTPDVNPFVLMSYLNKADDANTLAHELGHGVHAWLSRAQTYCNYDGTLPMAELASIFGEMLTFERLMDRASPDDRLAMLARKIEDIYASVFRQASMFRFEQRCHAERREQGELTAERFGDIWQEEMQSMFGRSVNLGDQHRSWWSYIGHFVEAPFYVYAYAFGELLTLSLYERWKRQGPEFAERYVELLRLGGSRSPEELMATVGVDLRSREFWQGGFDAIEGLLARFEELAARK